VIVRLGGLAEIANEVMVTVKPMWVKVELTQRPRGGIEVHAVAERNR
jgi:NADPH-dependent 7-cyano-7-deazaguanine reductase QueF